MALVSKTFSDIISFSRNSKSSRFNNSGLFEEVASGEPVIDYDPVTKACRGLGVWEQRTNLLSHSDRIENAVWHTNSAGYMLEKHAAISPSGKADAFKLVEDSSNGPHGIARSDLGLAVGTTYISLICAKAGERSLLILGSNTRDNQSTHVLFDLATGQSSALFNVGGLLINHWIVSLGGGWYLCAAAINAGTRGNGYRFSFSMSVPSAGNTGDPVLPKYYQGDGKSGLYVWGPGLQPGSFPTPHIPTPATFVSRATTATYFDANGVLQTAAANVARDNHHVYIDGAWRKAGLLLEGQATNLLPNSGPENSTNGVVSGGSITGAMPTGWSVANGLSGVVCEIVGSGAEKGMRFVDLKFSGQQTAGGFFNIQFGSANGLLSGTEYTFSIYLRKISGTSNPTFLIGGAGSWGAGGAYVYPDLASNEPSRVVASRTLTASGTAYPRLGISFSAGQIDFTARIYEAQLEAGPVATSPIPTSGSQVTRAADVSTSAQVTRAADVATVNAEAPWFNEDQGTIVVEAETKGTNAAWAYAQLWDGSTSNRIGVIAVNNAVKAAVSISGSVQVDSSSGVSAQSATVTAALSYAQDNVTISVNGGDPIKDTSAQIPDVTSMALGSSATTNTFLNGHLKGVRYLPRKVDDADLVELSR